jgi:hypothetical protein
MFLISLPLAAIVVRSMAESTTDIEGEIKVEDIHVEGIALPAGHHMAASSEKDELEKGSEYDYKGSHAYPLAEEVRK